MKFYNNTPIRKNIIANLFGVVVNLTNQVILVPFYILFWGNELYSDWIVVSALTTIFALSDVGLNNVIQNRFSIKLAEGDTKECNSLLTDNYILIGVTLLLTLFACGIFVAFFDITKVMNLHLLSRGQASWVLVILITKVFIGMLSGVENAIYRATHKASISVYMDQIGNFIVALITLACIVAGLSVVLLSVLICLPQLVILFIKHQHSKKYYYYQLRWKYADIKLFKQVLIPSLSFMSFPVGNMIIYEGYTLVVNTFFGADSVVLYNTTRTLCNFIRTLLNTLQSAVWPEYSIAYGNQDYAKMRFLHRKILKVTILLSLASCAGVLIFGPLIFRVWTRNAVEFNFSLMAVYVSAIFVESMWLSSSVTLTATNNHTKLGVVYIATTSFAIVLAIGLLYMVPDCSLALMTVSMILMHIIISCYAINAGFKNTKDSLKNILLIKHS